MRVESSTPGVGSFSGENLQSLRQQADGERGWGRLQGGLGLALGSTSEVFGGLRRRRSDLFSGIRDERADAVQSDLGVLLGSHRLLLDLKKNVIELGNGHGHKTEPRAKGLDPQARA